MARTLPQPGHLANRPSLSYNNSVPDERFAKLLGELMSLEAPETIIVEDHRVACDGGDGPLGHPLVYLEMGEDHHIQCPYCGRLYKQGGDHH